jgi:hypothetical protein
VYQFDALQYNGKHSFQSLVLIIQNFLPDSLFSCVPGSQRKCFVLCCSHYCLLGKKQTELMHAFQEGHSTQHGVKEECVTRINTKTGTSIDAMTGTQETRIIKSTQASKYKLYSNQLPKQRDSSIRKSD